MATNTAPQVIEERELPETEQARPTGDAAVPERATLARALQNLEDAKARVERDAAAVHFETRMKLVSELLPVLDDFDRAIAAARANGDAPSVVEGMQLVHRHLARVMEGYGLQRFDAVGAAFDPVIHDAMNMVAVEDPRQHRVVVAQYQPGYMFGDRVIRPAKVVVGKHTVAAT